MGTYQGPHVAVRQVFETNPPAVAIENLPPVAVGTAYDVYSKEFLDEFHGIVNTTLPWVGDNKDNVIWDDSVIGKRLYDFYPVHVYANTDFGYEELEADLSATGALIEKDELYMIPNTEKLDGYCEAFIPYYYKNLGAGNAKILAADLTTVIGVGASFATSKLQPGQAVLLGNEATPTSFVYVGNVAAIGSDETKIKLSAAYSAPVAFDTVVVGVSLTRDIGDTQYINLDRPNCICDNTADFVANKIKVGDVVQFQSKSFTGTKTATVTAIVGKTMIKINTTTPATGKEDYDLYTYKTSTVAPSSTISLSTYAAYRFVGFSMNYGMKDLDAGDGVPVVKVSSTSFKVLKTLLAPLMIKGDIIAITTTNVGTPAYYYVIETVTTDATHQIYTTTELIKNQTGSEYADGNFLHAWMPMIVSDILADWRAVRSEENKVAKRISSIPDIVAAWCKDETISPYNELAYMASIEFAMSGGRVCYGINVDSKAINLSAEYSEALDELKMIDVYSHCFGTTNGGVNALMSPYCNEQSAPYEAHERIGIICYDQEDVYLQGLDSGTISDAGVITGSGGFNYATAGIAVKDVVDVYNSSGVLQDTLNVIATPDIHFPSQLLTDGIDDYSGATMTFKMKSGRKDDQAIRINALGVGDRRVKVLWPGWFSAEIGGQSMIVPPYYLAAARCGMDCSVRVSQSCTNYDFAPAGLSNIELETNTYFRKAQLDEIGGGGIDICIQDVAISQIIKSRHDLTTNMDAIEYREWSITKQVDVVAKTIRASINPYIGKYNITPDLIKFIGKICSIVSTTLMKDSIVFSVQITSIERDTNIVDKLNIKLKVTVFVAGNYYDVELTIVSK